MKCHFLWITDSWKSLDHPRDTTLRLAEEAFSLGFENSWCGYHSIRWENGAPTLDAQLISEVTRGRIKESFKLGKSRPKRPTEFDCLMYRTDPPVDLLYLHPLQILSLSTNHTKGPRIVNPPSALFSANEKLECGALGDFAPPTTVSSQWDALSRFGHKESITVLKPLHLAQSREVELLDWRGNDAVAQARAIMERATDGFTKPVLLQRYLPAISEGEQRLWFLDGKLLAWVRKLPLTGDFRVNMDRGSRVVASELNSREKKAAARIAKRLAMRSIRLAAVDLIDGLVTDFNFTSPGLITQMESVLGENLARPIIKALARKH